MGLWLLHVPWLDERVILLVGYAKEFLQLRRKLGKPTLVPQAAFLYELSDRSDVGLAFVFENVLLELGQLTLIVPDLLGDELEFLVIEPSPILVIPAFEEVLDVVLIVVDDKYGDLTALCLPALLVLLPPFDLRLPLLFGKLPLVILTRYAILIVEQQRLKLHEPLSEVLYAFDLVQVNALGLLPLANP